MTGLAILLLEREEFLDVDRASNRFDRRIGLFIKLPAVALADLAIDLPARFGGLLHQIWC